MSNARPLAHAVVVFGRVCHDQLLNCSRQRRSWSCFVGCFRDSPRPLHGRVGPRLAIMLHRVFIVLAPVFWSSPDLRSCISARGTTETPYSHSSDRVGFGMVRVVLQWHRVVWSCLGV